MELILTVNSNQNKRMSSFENFSGIFTFMLQKIL